MIFSKFYQLFSEFHWMQGVTYNPENVITVNLARSNCLHVFLSRLREYLLVDTRVLVDEEAQILKIFISILKNLVKTGFEKG